MRSENLNEATRNELFLSEGGLNNILQVASSGKFLQPTMPLRQSMWMLTKTKIREAKKVQG